MVTTIDTHSIHKPIWQNQPLEINNLVGFVYIIINNKTGRYYIGQKKFRLKRKIKPTKDFQRVRRTTVESDWKTYYGSCKELQEDVRKLGKENFTRRITHLCQSKTAMNYYETKEQFRLDVLLDPLSYNGIINCRIPKRNMKPLQHLNKPIHHF